MLSTATAQRDEMLLTATTQRDDMLTEARERSTGHGRRGAAEEGSILEELGRERGLLESKIEELRGFERDYRSRLHSYIQGQLAELKNTGVERRRRAPRTQGEAAAEPQPERQS